MPSGSELEVDLCCLSHPGQEPTKQVNEDTGRVERTHVGQLALVCDGMGGHAHGQAASLAAVSTIVQTLNSQPTSSPGQALVQAIHAANQVVYQQGGGPQVEARPGSTCVAVLLHAHGAEIAHVGDSRAYLVRQGQLHRMTRDHSVVQQMLDAGMLTEEQALEHPDSNRITRALGMAPEVEVELRPGPFAVQAGDTFLLTSDGLTDLVSDSEILSIYSNRSPEGLETAGRALVEVANLRGGHDNITVVLMRAKTNSQARPTQSTGETAPGATTVVDGAAQATVVDKTAATMVSQAAIPTPERATAELTTEAVQPETARDTEPGPFDHSEGFGENANQKRFVSDYPAEAASQSSKGKLVLLLAAVFTAVIVGAIFLWWLIAAFSAAAGAPNHWSSEAGQVPKVVRDHDPWLL